MGKEAVEEGMELFMEFYDDLSLEDAKMVLDYLMSDQGKRDLKDLRQELEEE